MIILDNNIINDIMDKNIELRDDQVFYIPEDIRLEAELSSILKNKKVSKNIKDILSLKFFNEFDYYINYRYFLNHAGGNSFYSLKGFGDVAILASIKTLLMSPDFLENQRLPMTDVSEDIKIFTRDDGLIKRIENNFPDQIDKKIFILGLNDLML